MKLLLSFQGHETSALLILEKISDKNLINCTNTALQTYVVQHRSTHQFCDRTSCNCVPPPLHRPLHVAARMGLTVVVQELLVKGASVLAVDENGQCFSPCCRMHNNYLIYG